MNKIVNKLRIGEKIFFGFGLVGLLFLVVIWQYHTTLQNSLNDYQTLNDIYGTKKDTLFAIEVSLLNARQSEKDFLLQHKKSDAQTTLNKIHSTQKIIALLTDRNPASENTAQQIHQYLKQYLEHFQQVVESWEKKGLDENSGLQGSFRNAVHALEAMADSLQDDKIYLEILQLRRREKDYLLRGDQQYVEYTASIIQGIETRVNSSHFSTADKTQFLTLLKNYQRDFMALVEQNKHIIDVVKKMESSAIHVSQLISKNVISSNKDMAQKSDEIKHSSLERVTYMWWLALLASLSGALLAIGITSKIVKPLRKMSILLEELTSTEHIEHMPFQPEGRDEVNAMAGSLNILTEHRKRFINWWKNSMSEVEACTQLEDILAQLSKNTEGDSTEIQQIKDELTQTLMEKKKLIAAEYQEIRKYNDEILKQSALLDHASITRDDIDHGAKSIHYSASLIQKTLDMLSYEVDHRSF